jgi:hypothetical protein
MKGGMMQCIQILAPLGRGNLLVLGCFIITYIILLLKNLKTKKSMMKGGKWYL